jgi:flagellar biogenesis protein FliO
LAPIFWETIAYLFLVLLVLAAFSEVTFSPGNAMALGSQGFVLALLVALIFIFDRLFNRFKLSPKPIRSPSRKCKIGASTRR